MEEMENEISKTLKPCPFCGSRNVGVFCQDEDDCDYESAIARCFDCSAQTGQFVNSKTETKLRMAARAWNLRGGQI